MNINDYKYIVTIADLGSFTKAAGQLFIAQPSLSQRVKHIEDEYGITIFIRDKKGLRITEEGKLFVRYARQIIRCEEDLQKEILDMHNLSDKPLRIGIPQFINTPFFDRLILNYHRRFPNSNFEFIERPSIPLQQLLLSGEIDIAVCYLPISSSDIKYEIIYNDRFVLVPAKDSSLSRTIQEMNLQPGSYIDAGLLDNQPFSMATPGTKLHQYLTAVLDENNVRLDIRQISKNFSMLYSLARDGIASTILYESFFDPSEDHEPYYYLNSAENNNLSVAVAWRKSTYLRHAAKNLVLTARDMLRPGQ